MDNDDTSESFIFTSNDDDYDTNLTLAVGKSGRIPFNGRPGGLNMVGWRMALLQTGRSSYAYLSKQQCKDLAVALCRAAARMNG